MKNHIHILTHKQTHHKSICVCVCTLSEYVNIIYILSKQTDTNKNKKKQRKNAERKWHQVLCGAPLIN